jgi:hypothetical protein
MTDSQKNRLVTILESIIPAVTNGSIFEVKVGKLADNTTLVININVPQDKVGIVLGRLDESGKNPMKMALLKICKQVAYYQGFTEVLLKIGEISDDGDDSNK